MYERLLSMSWGGTGMNRNHGSKIFLRLRPPGALDTFYDIEQLVLVMLHEVSVSFGIKVDID
jgi:hypothetical protein